MRNGINNIYWSRNNREECNSDWQPRPEPYDVVFMFGENKAVKDNILLVEQHTKIVMSPQHAKVFSQVLARQISKYEETFGTISIPIPATEPEGKKKPS